MSVIRKKPFIETVIGLMNESQRSSLKTVLDNGGNNVECGFGNLPSGSVVPVLFELEKNNFKSGIYLAVGAYKVLIAYHRFQDLQLYKLNSNHTYEKINEYCDINELRRVLIDVGSAQKDAWVEVMKDVLAYDATENQVEIGTNAEVDGNLQVNGKIELDGVSLEEDDGALKVESLNVTDTLKIGGVIFDPTGTVTADVLGYTLTEGTALDSEDVEKLQLANTCYLKYDDKIYTKVENADSDAYLLFSLLAKEEYEWKSSQIKVTVSDGTWELVEDSVALTDGSYDTMTVGLAKQLESPDGDLDNSIFNYRSTAGSTSISSGVASVNQLIGKTYVKNQKSPLITSWDATYRIASVSYSGNSCTFTANQTGGRVFYDFNLTNDGHKMCAIVTIQNSNSNTSTRIFLNGGNTTQFVTGTNKKTVIVVFTQTLFDKRFIIQDFSDSDFYPITVINPMLIDLTQYFGAGNEITDINTLTRMFADYIPYNEGELINSMPKQLEEVGFNQWDEEWELGGIGGDGNGYVSSARIRSKNYTSILPNTTYYVKSSKALDFALYDINKNFIIRLYPQNSNITTPSNAYYCRFGVDSSYGTTYNHDICINLSWSGLKNGTYEPYEKNVISFESALSSILGSDPFRGVGAIGDTIDFVNHKYIKKFGIVDLGNLSWELDSSGYFQTSSASPLTQIKHFTTTETANIICQKYTTKPLYLVNQNDKSIGIYWYAAGNRNPLRVKDSSYTDAQTFKNAMSGVYLVYELADYVTTDIDPNIRHSIVANDWGTEMWVDKNIDNLPVHSEILYEKNLLDKLRNLPDSANTNGTYLISQTSGVQSLTSADSLLTDVNNLKQHAKLKALTLVNGVSTESTAKNVHVLVKLVTDDGNYCSQFDLVPYNTSESVNTFYIANTFATAYIDENAKINIELPSSLSGTLTAKYYEYEE